MATPTRERKLDSYISVRVAADVQRQLERAADEAGVPYSWLVRETIAIGLATFRKKGSGRPDPDLIHQTYVEERASSKS